MSGQSALQLLDNIIFELEASINSSQLSKQPASDKTKIKESAVSSSSEDNVIAAAQKIQQKSVLSKKEVTVQSKPSEAISVNSIDLRVGVIVNVKRHETAEKLYCEEIDVGEDKPRAIASGLVHHYSLQEMEGRRLIVVCNLKPRNLVGFKSHGMVLCAVKITEDGKEKVEFVDPPADAKPGDRIIGLGLNICDPLSPSQCDKQKAFEIVAKDLRVDSEGIAIWGTTQLVTSSNNEFCKAPTIRDGLMR